MAAELMAFLSHLRLHYQFLILSGAFLAGAVIAGGAADRNFIGQFLNVHILLFGGVTVYNSYWDKDKGPIGGMREPPPLAFWTLPGSWLLQVLGLALGLLVSYPYALVYAVSMVFFWAYSRPGIRWKGRPWLSLVAIGASTGVCGFLMGYLHGGRAELTAAAFAGAAGTAFLIVSLFPMSQVYQVEEDLSRSDVTFTAKFGLQGVKRAYAALFPAGVVLLSLAMAAVDARLGATFLILGSISGAGVWWVIRGLRQSPEEYGKVMGVKYAASGLFAAFLGAVLWLQAMGRIAGP